MSNQFERQCPPCFMDCSQGKTCPAVVAKVGKSRMGWVGEDQPLDDEMSTPAFAILRAVLIFLAVVFTALFAWRAAVNVEWLALMASIAI